jgi:hypothetical protein
MCIVVVSILTGGDGEDDRISYVIEVASSDLHLRLHFVGDWMHAYRLALQHNSTFAGNTFEYDQ